MYSGVPRYVLDERPNGKVVLISHFPPPSLRSRSRLIAIDGLADRSIVFFSCLVRVTETDKANEKLIFDAVRKSFPDDQLIGEESSADAGSIAALTDAPTWIVDPVDGEAAWYHGGALCQRCG